MGALIPLAISLAPEIGRWLFGDKGEAVASAATQAIATVTGTKDEIAAASVLARDPALAGQLRVQLAQIAADQEEAARAADLAALQAQLGDTQNARAQTIALAQAKSAVQWAPVIVSMVVLTTFGTVMWAALTRQLPTGSETLLNMLLGTLAAMATSAVNYWVGSSAGSVQKNELLYRSQPARTGAPG